MSASETSMIGKFNSLADLKMYQTLWQVSTFEPAWKSLREHVSLQMDVTLESCYWITLHCVLIIVRLQKACHA